MEITYDMLLAKFEKEQLDNALITIHKALHNYNQKSIKFGAVDKPILVSKNNSCRYIAWNGINIMEQNRVKDSTFATIARKGKALSWAMFAGQWCLVTDNHTYHTKKLIEQFLDHFNK